MQNVILHITADFPDAVNKGKTKAVQYLVESSKHKSYVVSLNRTSVPCEKIYKSDDVLVIKYFALPFAIFHQFFLRRLSKKIVKHLPELNFSLIHAHKLSIEGVCAFHIGKEINVPYVVNLWGATDRKFIKLKPSCSYLYKKVLLHASYVLPASPWILSWVRGRLSVDIKDTKLHSFPVITKNTKVLWRPDALEAHDLVSVFNLNLYKLKGLPNLLDAIIDMPNVGLDIYGKGTIKSIKKIKALIANKGLLNRVFIKGYLDSSQVIDVISKYKVFVMPTRNETYGMVYIESLCAGVPIIYSKNQGIDGFFEEAEVGLSVDPFNSDTVKNAIIDVLNNIESYKLKVFYYQKEGKLEKFLLKHIVNEYDTLVSSLCRKEKKRKEY